MNEPALPPEKWRYLFDKIDVEFGYRPLATHINMDHTRLRRLLLGGGTTNEAIQAVADAFKVKPNVIRELRGEQPIEYEPFTLPDDAGRLTHTERNVIRSMVRALLDARGEHAVPTSQATPTRASRKKKSGKEAGSDTPEPRPTFGGFGNGTTEDPGEHGTEQAN